ncbi:MAG: hypothetical protein ACQESE_01155 [Nanobdellota archaeon]
MFSGNKKGFDTWQIITITVAIITLIAISSIWNQAHGSVKESFDGVACRATIHAHDITDTVFTPGIEKSCATRERRISLKDKTKDDLIKELEKLMANSWLMVNEGRSDDLWEEDAPLKKAGYSCMATDHIFFEDVDKRDFEEEMITPEEIRAHMKESYKNDDYTYHMYIQGHGGVGTYKITDNVTFNNEYIISIASPHFNIFTREDEFATGLILSSLETGKQIGCKLV